MDKFDEKYKELLIKFSGNDFLDKLIDLVIVDNEREREKFYMENNKTYPDKRDLLGKLKVDLFTTKKFIDEGGNKNV